MGYLSELFENADLANVFGGQDKKEKRLMDKMRGEYADSQTTMGSTLHGGAQPQAAQASPMPMQQQAPARDFSGASGNPFAQRAQQMGFSDYQGGQMRNPDMMQQKGLANALRGGARYG